MRPRRWAVPLLLAATVLAALLVLEARTPFYFLQDDNRAQYLPMFVHAYDALLKGQVAVYDFHQFLGFPSLASGQTAVLYPPMYLALRISALLFGHLQGGIDVLAVLHLVAAALGTYLLARLLGLSRGPSFLAGLSWALCSFVVYVGDSWIVYTAFAAWFPYLLAGALLVLRRPGPWPVALLVGARTILFYAGHPQNFLYSALFEVLFVGLVALADVRSARRALPADGAAPARAPRFLVRYALSVVLTAAACMPLLLPMLAAMAASQGRSGALPLSTYLSGNAKPADLLKGLTDPFVAGNSLNSARMYSFIGRPMLALAALGTFVGLLGFLRTSPPGVPGLETAAEAATRRTVRRILVASVPLGGFAYLWATNQGVTQVLYFVPILNRFRWPFKLTAFLLFFLVLLGAAGYEAVRDALSSSRTAATGEGPPPRGSRALWAAIRPRLAPALLAAALVVLQLLDFGNLYLNYERKSLKVQTEAIPLTEPFAAILGNDRVASEGFDAGTRSTGRTLGYDYASLFGVYHFGGYDPLVSADNAEHASYMNYDAMINRNGGAEASIANLAYFRTWGVRYYVAPNGPPSAELAAMAVVATDADRTLYRDDAAVPMAFAYEGEGTSADGVALAIGTNDLTVRTDRATASTVVVCFLANPSFVLTVDGVRQTLGRDAFGRMTYAAPAGAHVARIVYRDRALERGLAVLLLAAVATVVGLLPVGRRIRRRAAPKAPSEDAPAP